MFDQRFCVLQVIFSEPIVITACEFLEQSASSVAQTVTLVGYVLFLLFGFKIVETHFLYLLGVCEFDCCFEM